MTLPFGVSRKQTANPKMKRKKRKKFWENKRKINKSLTHKWFQDGWRETEKVMKPNIIIAKVCATTMKLQTDRKAKTQKNNYRNNS